MNREAIERIIDYLADQTYQGEPILHAIIACDFASRAHMVNAILRHLENQK